MGLEEQRQDTASPIPTQPSTPSPSSRTSAGSGGESDGSPNSWLPSGLTRHGGWSGMWVVAPAGQRGERGFGVLIPHLGASGGLHPVLKGHSPGHPVRQLFPPCFSPGSHEPPASPDLGEVSSPRDLCSPPGFPTPVHNHVKRLFSEYPSLFECATVSCRDPG